MGTSLAVWAALVTHPQVYYEVLEDGLLQTTATENQVNLAVASVLEAKRGGAKTRERALTKAEYREEAAAWFTTPDLFGQQAERASRFVRTQIDRDGLTTRVEMLHGEDMPTLVFVHHDDAASRDATAQWVGAELALMGVNPR